MNNNLQTPGDSLEELTIKLKNEDSNYAKISKSFQIMYWVFIPVYLLLSIFELKETGDINYIFSGICYAVSFLVFALVFRNYYREYITVNYSLPTLEMLKKAALRYKLFRLKTLWIVAALLFLDAGLCFNTNSYFNVLKIQALYMGSLLLGVIAGLIVWRIKYKPLRDNLLSMVSEIEKI